MMTLGQRLIIAAVFILSCFSGATALASKKLKGSVKIDGSSTVFPITEAVAEEFGKVHPRVRVKVAMSGTGGGFKKFSVGRIDINDASRKIKAKEIAKAKKNGVSYLEIPVAYDGISVVVNPKNTWVKNLTTAQLKKIWSPGSKVKTWKDINPAWPNRKIKLYGPGTDSGTFDYFTKAINGKEQSCRSDFTKSEDDNVLVTGVNGDLDSLGFFGFAYYYSNKTKLKVVPVDNGKGPVTPTLETIKTGKYAPLSRPIFIYVSKKSSAREEVSSFVNFYIENAGALSKEVGYIPMPKSEYNKYALKYKKFAVKNELAAK